QALHQAVARGLGQRRQLLLDLKRGLLTELHVLLRTEEVEPRRGVRGRRRADREDRARDEQRANQSHVGTPIGPGRTARTLGSVEASTPRATAPEPRSN